MKSKIPPCPECRRQKLRSSVFEEHSQTTLIGGSTAFRDADGVHHDHDPNWVTTQYKCSQNHVFQIRGKKKCPSCGFQSDESPTVIS